MLGRNYYAPKLAQKPRNKKPVRILVILGIVFLLTEILLMAPGLVAGIMLVRSWMYLLMGGLCFLCFMAALTVRLFQAQNRQSIMRIIAVSVICIALSIGISIGTVIYSMIANDISRGMYDSPNGQYSLYVVRIASYDNAGNETGAVYRGYRCFTHSVYIYGEDEVPAGETFQVEWQDPEHAVLTSDGESVTVSFTTD